MKSSFLKNSSVSISLKIWFALIAYLIVTKIILDTLLPNAFADIAQAAFFGWVPLGVFAIIGLIGVVLSQKTGVPDIWEGKRPFNQNILFPILTGFGIGVLMVSIDLFTGFTKLIAARHGVSQQYTDFPSMFFIFISAAIVVEVVYRLFLIPFLLWIISNVILKNKAQTYIFWTLAVLTSLLEPLGQYPDLQVVPGYLSILLGLIYFSINLTQAGFFRKYGFLAAIMVRIGFYFVWHVLYVH
jgi:hypothetical protein